MADAAVTFLLENLAQLWKYYADLISGAEDELEGLKKDLLLLKAWLEEASKKKKKEEQFKALENEIREVVYDVEDTIDTCLTEAAATAAAKSKINRSKNVLRKIGRTKKSVGLAEKVKSMRETKVKPLYDDARQKFATMEIRDGSGIGTEQSMEKERKEPTIRQDNVVGFLDVTEDLVKYLLEEKDQLDIIPIVGMAGLGKTTVAWKVFQDSRVEYKFHTRIWVYVSNDFNRKDVFLSILKTFSSEDMSGLNDHELCNSVRACLEKGEFILFIDDVNPEAWNAIRDAMPMNFAKGKVVITTRDEVVATRASATRKPYKLRFLDEEESWELLQLEAFKERNVCPEDLQDIGQRIAKKCGGLPLALVVIGGILHDKYSRKVAMVAIIDAWNMVSDNVSAHFNTNDKENSIVNVVSLSYNRLSSKLRCCFLYMGMFPGGHEIPTSMLTKLWIAEGFIQTTAEQTLEENAEEILHDLIDRNLVMVEMRRPNGEAKTCRVHDVMREFCHTKAKEQNLFQEIKWTKDQHFHPPISDLQNFHRLSIHSHISDFLKDMPTGKRVRTFLCFYNKPATLPAEYTNFIPDAFNLLRVLDVKSFRYIQFPIKVTKLLHLRYITLCCGFEFEELPEAISKLWNLQTITVETRSRTLKVKESIWKLIQLRHLKTNACIVVATEGTEKGKKNIGAGTSAIEKEGQNLQTLGELSPECCTEKLFEMTPNLKKLGIRGDIAKLMDTKGLERLEQLEKLKLFYDLLKGCASDQPLRDFLPRERFPKRLKRLTLSSTYLDWSYISTLGGIETLQVLKLKDNASKGHTWRTPGGGCFPFLDFLLIADSELASWKVAADDFPRLRFIVLKNCEQLLDVPSALEKSLQILDLNRVGKSAVESAKKIQERKKNSTEQMQRWGSFKLFLGPGDK